MNTNFRLRSLLSFLCGALAATLTTSALAQEAAEEQEPTLEEIVVTGSYLYTGVDSPSPVSVITGDTLRELPAPDLMTYFFENVPQNYSVANIAQTEATGQLGVRSIRSAGINLRALGDENTLTILNGRRAIAYAVPDQNGWRAVDINSLVPQIAIQRIELLLDGGSATYGSDPVAGVANFVTRNDFRGFDLQLDSRINPEKTSAKNVTFGALWGAGDDNTNVIAAIEFHQEDLITLLETAGEDILFPDVSLEPVGVGLENTSSGAPALTYVGGTGMGAPSWVDPDCGNPAFGGGVLSHYPAVEDANGNLIQTTNSWPASIAELSADPTGVCGRPNNFNPNQSLANNNVTQILAFASAEHRFSDALSVNLEVNFSRQRFDDIEAWGDRSNNIWDVPPVGLGAGFAVPTYNPGLIRVLGLDPTFAAGMAGLSPVYQAGETLPFLYETDGYNESDLFRAAFGLDGRITGSWEWHADATASYNDVSNGVRDIVTERYPHAVAGLGGNECFYNDIDPATLDDVLLDPFRGTGDCYFYNPFMSSALPVADGGIPIDPQLQNWLAPIRVSDFSAEQWTADLLVTGEVGELPGGPIGIAFGIASRHEFASRDSDILANNGQWATTDVYNDWSGSQDVDSMFFEVALPITQDFDLQIAARNEDYDAGFSETSPKIAGIWRATERLTVRASFGSSFRAPAIGHTAASSIISGFGPRNVVIDGVTYGQGGMIFTLTFDTQPNPDLTPQLSDNLSAGFDWDINDQISVGAAWVGIDFSNRINSPISFSVAQSCVVTDAAGIPVLVGAGMAAQLQFIPVGQTGLQGQTGCMVAIDPSLPITEDNVARLLGQPSNLGTLDAEFLDLDARMNWQTRFGMLSFTPNVTVALKYEFPRGDERPGFEGTCPPPERICNGLGRDVGGMGGFAGVSSMPRWQGNFPVGLRFGDHNVRVTPTYRDSINDHIDDLSDDQRATFTHNDGQWTVNVNWSWQMTPGSSLSASVSNLFDEDPPGNNSARFSRTGRSFGLVFRHSFEN